MRPCCRPDHPGRGRVRRAVRALGGNPFFTEELIKSLVDSGDVFHSAETGWSRKPIDQMKIPGSVRDAVRARVGKPWADAQATLSAAAAIGPRFFFDLLRTLRGIPEAALEVTEKRSKWRGPQQVSSCGGH